MNLPIASEVGGNETIAVTVCHEPSIREGYECVNVIQQLKNKAIWIIERERDLELEFGQITERVGLGVVWSLWYCLFGEGEGGRKQRQSKDSKLKSPKIYV